MRLFSWVDEATEAELTRIRELMARELFDYTVKLILLGSLFGCIWSVVSGLEVLRLVISVICLSLTIFLLWFTRAQSARTRLLSLTTGILVVCGAATPFNGGVLAPAYSAFFCLFSILVWHTSMRVTLLVWAFYLALGIVSTWGLERGWITPLASPLNSWQYIGFFGLFMLMLICSISFIRAFIYGSLKEEHRGRILLKTLYDSIDEPMIIYSKTLEYMQSNHAGERFIQRLRDDLSITLLEVTVRDHELSIAELIKSHSEAPYHVELSLDGRALELSCTPLLKHDQFDGYVVRIRDVSEQLKQQQKMMHIEKLKAIGEVTSSVVHDFGNTLMSLQGMIALIKEDQTSSQEEWIDLALKTIDQSQDQLQQLLTFARDDPERMRVVDLNPVIKQSVKLIRGCVHLGIEVTLELEDSDPQVTTDISMFTNILINLALNAAHAMGEAGKLLINTETVCSSKLRSINAHDMTQGLAQGDYLKLSVIDTGCGIAPDELPHIFEPFYTTKESEEGTGLGLANLDQFMKRSQGAIEVTSTLGEGTQFDLYFPLVSVEASETL